MKILASFRKKIKEKTRPVDYDFKAKDQVDYELEFKLNIKNKLMNKVFVQTLKALKKKKKVDIQADLSKVKRFDVEPKFYMILNTALKKQLYEAIGKIKKNGIEILNHKVIRAHFERDEEDDWIIKTYFGGQYVDKRERE